MNPLITGLIFGILNVERAAFAWEVEIPKFEPPEFNEKFDVPVASDFDDLNINTNNFNWDYPTIGPTNDTTFPALPIVIVIVVVVVITLMAICCRHLIVVSKVNRHHFDCPVRRDFDCCSAFAGSRSRQILMLLPRPESVAFCPECRSQLAYSQPQAQARDGENPPYYQQASAPVSAPPTRGHQSYGNGVPVPIPIQGPPSYESLYGSGERQKPPYGN